MSGHDKNISLYSASDIQKYLRGELSAPEMHQLELAALEDPLLSDALEGMEIHHSLPSSPSLHQDLEELQKRLDNRVGQKDRKGVLLLFRSPWKVAAVLILLLGLGLTAYFTFLNTARQKNSLAKDDRNSAAPSLAAGDTIALDKQTAQKQTSQKEQASAKEADHSSEPAASPSANKPPETAKTSKQEDLATGNTIRKASRATGSGEAPPAGEAATTIDDKEKATPEKEAAVKKADHLPEPAALSGTASGYVQAPMERANYKTLTIRGRKDTTAYKKDTAAYLQGMAYSDQYASVPSAAPDQLVFTGKVIDQNNKPLPGASLHLKDNYLVNTTTDKNGFFSLRLPKTDSAAKLTVAYVGYEQASLGLSAENRTGNVIQLQPQANALNEVVVTGYGAKRKEIIKDNSQPRKEFLTKRAIPAEGWPAYQSYLEVNKKATNPDSTLKGDVIISFIVNKEEGLSSFKVEQSLSPAHDSAAIRLIQQGPSWKLLKGKKTRAWVTISF
jgi:cytoskeletal protein RodZ